MSVTRPEPSNADLEDRLKDIQNTLATMKGTGGTGPGWTPGTPGAPSLTDAPGNKPYQVPVPVVRMPPIAEVVEMVATRQKGWEGKGAVFNEPSVRMWLTNLLHNWEQNGVTYEPWYVGAQLQSHADAWTAQWLDTGTGVDVKAIITALVQHYVAWRADQAK